MDHASEAAGWTGAPCRVAMPLHRAGPVVFSSPHSGRRYPRSLLGRSRLDALALRASEDAFVDLLFADAPRHGAPLVMADFPRAFVDVNRAVEELDPALILDAPRPRARSLRVSAGLGVVPRVVSENRPIYDGKLAWAEVRARLDSCYRPYHATLRSLLEEARRLFGVAILIDCHSMPSDPRRARRPDIILGDCFGAACAPDLAQRAAESFSRAGFAVGRNAPFAGGYITQHYGRPGQGIEALQIEIDRGLYLDEARVAPAAHFEQVRARLAPVIRDLARLRGAFGAVAAE